MNLKRMSARGLVIGALALEACGLTMLPACAQVPPPVVYGPPPPPPPPPLRYEIVPAPRPHWVWVPGHWVWGPGRYAWEPGHWRAAYRRW